MNALNKYSKVWDCVHVIAIVICIGTALQSFSKPIDIHVRTEEMLKEYQDKSLDVITIEIIDEDGNKKTVYIA